MKTDFEKLYEEFQLNGFDVRTVPKDQIYNILRQYIFDAFEVENDEFHDYSNDPVHIMMNLAYIGQTFIWDLQKEVKKYRDETIEVKKELSRLRRGK